MSNDSAHPLHQAFDYLNPDYHTIWAKRVERLAKLDADRGLLAASKLWYKEHPADFINDWGVTVDPRNAALKRPIIMPFVLFPKQTEMVNWIYTRWHHPEDGLVVKSRDCGASWLAMAFSATTCMFWENVSIGFGSAKEDKVDRSGDPDSLFYKGRMFMNYLPRCYRGAWTVKHNSAHMRLIFPDTESSITGEAGDQIGRGGRKTIYFVDEFAVVERPKLVDSALLANTDCRVEMSTVNGLANVFAERARGGLVNRFDFHYRDDPRKVDPVTKEMRPLFAAKKAKADPVAWKQEYECDFLASAEGIIIPQEWVQACIGARQKLGLPVTGERRATWDVGDRGQDKNCMAEAQSVELQYIESWAGGPTTIFKSTQKVMNRCEDQKIPRFNYDADGIGGGVRGDAERINDDRTEANRVTITAEMFRGSSAVMDPERLTPGSDRKNKDFFANYKAQCWWALRRRAHDTWNWVVNGIPCDPDGILSIAPDLPELTTTTSQLSQPQMTFNTAGKMVIDKQPDDVASPNNADAVMMAFPYSRGALDVSEFILQQFGAQEDE